MVGKDHSFESLDTEFLQKYLDTLSRSDEGRGREPAPMEEGTPSVNTNADVDTSAAMETE